MDPNSAPLNINDVKRQLQSLEISTSTPGLQGDDRFEELCFRLEVAKKTHGGKVPPNPKVENDTAEAGGSAVPSLAQLSIGEIRARLTALGENTNTPGVTGEERRNALMRRLINAVCNENSENEIVTTKVVEVKPEEKPKVMAEQSPEKQSPPAIAPAVVLPVAQPQPVDPGVSAATISALKNDLKRMLNQRALAVASKLSGANQDEQLRSSEGVLSRIEMEIAHYKLLQQKGETKLPTESIKSEFLVLNPAAAGFAIEALINRLEGCRSSCKEKIRNHRLRIRQEGDDHPQFGIAAEERLKILLSEANLSSLSSTSNNSSVSRTRQKISEMKAMETQLEEQGKVSPAKSPAKQEAPAVSASVKAAVAAPAAARRAPPPEQNTVTNAKSSTQPASATSKLASPERSDKWSTDLLPDTVIYMKAPVPVPEKDPTKQDVYASKLPNFTSSFLGKAIDLDAGTGSSSKTIQRPSEKAPVALPVKPDAAPVAVPSKPAGGGSEPAHKPPPQGRSAPPEKPLSAPRTLQGRRPPPATESPPAHVSANARDAPDNGVSPLEFEEDDAYFQEADEVDTRPQYAKPAQVHPSAGPAASAEHVHGDNTTAGTPQRHEFKEHENAGEEDRESDRDDEEAGEFVPDDLPGDADGWDTYSESAGDYGKVYGTHRQINTAADDDDLEELANSPMRTGTSSSGGEFRESAAEGTAFPFPNSASRSQTPELQAELAHRMYSIDENDAPESTNASADVTPVMSKKVGKKLEYSGERHVPPQPEFNARSRDDEGERKSPLVNPQDELKFTIPGYEVEPNAEGGGDSADQDNDGADGGDDNADGGDGVDAEGVGEEGLDEEAEREADEKAQIRVLRSHAKVLENLNDVAAAEEVHMRALELDPTNITTLEGFAQFLHQKKGELARAEAFFNRGLQVCLPGLSLKGPGSANSTPQSNHKAHQGHNGSGMSFATDSTMQGNKVKHIIKFILSYAHFMSKSKGDIEAASVLYKKGVDLAPDNAFLLATYAHFLAQVGDKESMAAAVEYFQKALKLSPGNGQYCMWYGKLLKRLGKTGQAELMYKVALEQTRGNSSLEPTAICNYATFIFKQRKDPERAIGLFKAGLEAYPEHKGLRKNYATVVKAHPHFGGDQPELPRRSQSSQAAGRAERLAQRAMDSIRDESSPVGSAQEDDADSKHDGGGL